ncbi:MAG: nitrilase-related carbon-nitrogen hydrolase [Bacteroidota bacterium]|nr:nitrilase-related carbon-nitrogen hydrolase [Bacteroidota bacterium]MDP4234388.1 nitrilase-related carbon-nitrogen hydrolase [Bacteroidota bacterium]MDP4243321.1 nitrilase-related carbon-nitrogen hydrolase [Bacteroidota bacterium]MDP4288006.1 nitrilase-related carbon-nitrogen hydrolase [Bacteroidota bacterium]
MLLKPSKIVLAQTGSVLGDVAKNVAHHADLTRQAIDAKADAIIFPELSLSGYTVRDLNFEIAIDLSNGAQTSSLKPLLELSKQITIICGAVEEDERGAVYNSALLIESGEVRHTHHKVYPPTYGLFEEGRYFRSGHEAQAFDSKRLGRIGLLVCEDLWHPALPYVEALDDAQMIITIAASPTRLDTGEAALTAPEPENYTINREHHAAYARLLSVFLVFVNRIGVEDGVNFWGGSEVVAPSGETIARGKFFDEDFVTCEINPDQLRQARQLSRHFLDDRPLLTRHLIETLMERK